MKISVFAPTIVLLSATLLSGGPASPRSEIRPEATLAPEGDQYALFGDPGDDLHYSATTTPVPRNPGDIPSGPPVYHWDFGPLHGEDTGNGTAVVHTDVEGSYPISVYCEQTFIDAHGHLYTLATRPSP